MLDEVAADSGGSFSDGRLATATWQARFGGTAEDARWLLAEHS